mgnify:FL=1
MLQNTKDLSEELLQVSNEYLMSWSKLKAADKS